jgi:hypothetical protein
MNIFQHQKDNDLQCSTRIMSKQRPLPKIKKAVSAFQPTERPKVGFFFDGEAISLIENGKETHVLDGPTFTSGPL